MKQEKHYSKLLLSIVPVFQVIIFYEIPLFMLCIKVQCDFFRSNINRNTGTGDNKQMSAKENSLAQKHMENSSRMVALVCRIFVLNERNAVLQESYMGNLVNAFARGCIEIIQNKYGSNFYATVLKWFIVHNYIFVSNAGEFLDRNQGMTRTIRSGIGRKTYEV